MKNVGSQISVYGYTDHRAFLADCFAQERERNPAFSYAFFAAKAGYRSKTYMHKVINGERPLSQTGIHRVARALKMSVREADYFDALVNFNQSKSDMDREFYFSRLKQTGKKRSGMQLSATQSAYFENWYNVVIRELVTLVDFDEDYGALANLVVPAITPRAARDAVEKLLALGLVKKSGDAKYYEQTEPNVVARNSLVTFAIRQFQKQMAQTAIERFETAEPLTSDFSTLTLGLNDDGLAKVKTELAEFRQRLSAIANDSNPSTRVYHLNLHLFPVSQLTPKRQTQHEHA